MDAHPPVFDAFPRSPFDTPRYHAQPLLWAVGIMLFLLALHAIAVGAIYAEDIVIFDRADQETMEYCHTYEAYRLYTGERLHAADLLCRGF